MSVVDTIQYKEEMALAENQKAIREMVLKSLEDKEEGRGQDFNKFFDELERRYHNA